MHTGMFHVEPLKTKIFTRVYEATPEQMIPGRWWIVRWPSGMQQHYQSWETARDAVCRHYSQRHTA